MGQFFLGKKEGTAPPGSCAFFLQIRNLPEKEGIVAFPRSHLLGYTIVFPCLRFSRNLQARWDTNRLRGGNYVLTVCIQAVATPKQVFALVLESE